jgi:hypothetical protein
VYNAKLLSSDARLTLARPIPLCIVESITSEHAVAAHEALGVHNQRDRRDTREREPLAMVSDAVHDKLVDWNAVTHRRKEITAV